MKFLFICSIFTLGVLSGQMSAQAAQPLPEKFEINPNCIFNKDKAKCFVPNKTDEVIRCEIKIVAKSDTRNIVSHYANVPIKPYKNAEISLHSNGEITNVVGHASCKKE